MASRRPGRAGQRIGDLAPDERHLGGRPIVGLRGKETDETGLSRWPAILAVPLDPDVIHIAAAVNAASEVRLGDRHRLRQVNLPLHLGGEDGRLGTAAQDGTAGVAQDTDPLGRLVKRSFGRIAAVGGSGIVVVAGPEKDEMVVVQPAQEGDVLGHDLRIDPTGMGLKVGDRARHQGAHLTKVRHRQMDICQSRLNRRPERLTALRRQGIKHDDDQRLARIVGRGPSRTIGLAGQRQHGVKQGPNRDAAVGQFTHDTVNKKRPVVLNDPEHIVGRLPPPGHDEGFNDHTGGFPRYPTLAPAPGVCQKAGHIVDRKLRRLVLGIVLERLVDERLFQAVERSPAPYVRKSCPETLGAEGKRRCSGVARHEQVSFSAASCGRRSQLPAISLPAPAGKPEKKRPPDGRPTASLQAGAGGGLRRPTSPQPREGEGWAATPVR